MIEILVGVIIRSALRLGLFGDLRDDDDSRWEAVRLLSNPEGPWGRERLSRLRDALWSEMYGNATHDTYHVSESPHYDGGDCDCGQGFRVVDLLKQEAYGGYIPDAGQIQELEDMSVLTPYLMRALFRRRSYGSLFMHANVGPSDLVMIAAAQRAGKRLRLNEKNLRMPLAQKYWSPYNSLVSEL